MRADHGSFATGAGSGNRKGRLHPPTAVLLGLLIAFFGSGCGSLDPVTGADNGAAGIPVDPGDPGTPVDPPGGGTSASFVVNSLADTDSPPAGQVTLRAAIRRLLPGGTITFDPSLNGQTIPLSIVGESHSVLKGEVFTPSEGGGWTFGGFQDRDYGRSALYARKDLTIDASSLPNGITLAWTGGSGTWARVLAVYGNLTMKKITVNSGIAGHEALTGGTQPFTLGRGGGLAVWGTATLANCTVSGNRAEGDNNDNRDRGAFGGGIYANRLVLDNCVVSGNAATGFGAAGGGIYSVGGAGDDAPEGTTLSRCVVTGNRVTAQHAYGGGVCTDGRGSGKQKTLELRNCTVARNKVADNPGIAESSMARYYYRGGGVYMSNGYLVVKSCTIAENEVTGSPAAFGGKPNMGGGGIAATVGDAHVVEDMKIRHSIVAGNRVGGAADDVYTGSLLEFVSLGYNLFGKVDFSQIHVPVPRWNSLSRKHWPKIGDLDGIEASQVLKLNEIRYHASIDSAGTDEGRHVVLWYPPEGAAVDKIPTNDYTTEFVRAEYQVVTGKTDDFLNRVLAKVRTLYGGTLGRNFGWEFGSMSGVTFYGPQDTWPSNPQNAPWIKFWRDLDTAINGRLGSAGLADTFWGSFQSGLMGDNIMMSVSRLTSDPIRLDGVDQLENLRPHGSRGDIGAIERQ